MKSCSNIAVCIFAATLLLAASLAVGETLEERKWLDARSENFRIRSVLGEERTVELLRHLEIMHEALGYDVNVAFHAPVNPTIILAVDNHEDYVDVGAPSFTSGYFFSDPRENAILIEDTPDSSGVQIILHEYAHYLNRQAGRIRYPRWFEEGNAEYLSHSRVHDNAFEFARPAVRHIATLGLSGWMAWSALLEVGDTSSLGLDEGALFYAQSWLLVHFLRSRPDADQTLPRDLERYSELASQTASATEAFEKSFRIDTGALNEELLRYYLDRQFTSRSLPVSSALSRFAPRVYDMSQAEARLALVVLDQIRVLPVERADRQRIARSRRSGTGPYSRSPR